MKFVLVSYNNDPTWVKEYTDDWLIFDRSDVPFDFPNTTKTDNVGNVDYDKLRYLVDYYDDLPEAFVWGKTNLFKYITKEEFDKVKDNKYFTPLLTQNHQTYQDRNGWVCYYGGGTYHERNNSWYLDQFPSKFASYGEFAHEFQLPSPPYLQFAPGGNYILTREVVHKYSRDFYDKMASTLPYCQLPGEAQMCERSYFNMWK